MYALTHYLYAHVPQDHPPTHLNLLHILSVHPPTVSPSPWNPSIPLVACEVIVDASLHVLEGIQCGKHVDQLGQRQEVGLRDEVFPLFWMSKSTNLVTEAIGSTLDKSHQLFCFRDFRAKHLNSFLIDLHSVGLFMCFDLWGEGRRREREREEGDDQVWNLLLMEAYCYDKCDWLCECVFKLLVDMAEAWNRYTRT